ncbi:relaxase/mobilization nuclease domain-containing protein [Candidatus Palauibacter sp.]|uniref:relaxase/mobilization nuclease domain-containing protein n=1 Tax=Candidatus Palauibacter sp. TaxID=3101350 RepID=UPI003B010E13
MIPKINGLGRSFAGVAAYCLHDAPEPDDRSPETSERVAWTDTRNLATIRPERAARLMAATAKAAPDLKRRAGGARGGRKLAKPVLHYSLSRAREETPTRQEMSQAVDGSLEALGMEGHEALIVAHDDTRHPHVQVIANRVDPETGKAAKLGNSKLRLSRWAEGYGREQGRIRCERRVTNNERRRTGAEVLRPIWDRALAGGAGRRGPGPGGPGRGLARGSRPVPQGRAGRAGQGARRQRPADRAEGARDVPKGAA